ncbi:MAG: hypothetical protein H0V76_08760 [Blastocatellia bacterium]|nr:hypothetical protein [Blastocatellia bacterium]
MAIFKKKTKAAAAASAANVWARPEMEVTFRAEIMPGKSSEERTFRIQSVRPNGRVHLYNFPDEHLEGSFEPINFARNVTK